MNEEEIARYVLKRLAGSVDDAVVSLSDSKETQLKFFNSKLSGTNTWDIKKLSILAVSKKRIVTTSLKDFTKDAADDTIKKAIKYIEASVPNPEYEGIAKGPFTYQPVECIYDPNIAQNKTDFVKILKEAISTAANLGIPRCAGVLEHSTDSVYILTSSGVEAREKSTGVYFSIRAIMDAVASGHKIGVGCRVNDLDFNEIAGRAATIANQAQKPQSIEPGKYDIVFDPLPFANIIDHVGGALSSFYVDAGLSWYKDRLSQDVASKIFTLHDIGNLKGGVGSSAFDEEGRPTQDTRLIENGTLKGFLHNTSTAKKYGVNSTSNAGIISPEPTNLVVKPGKKCRDELIRMVDDGLYVTNTWYTRFNNHSTGDFSTIPRDGIFRIKNGSIKYPLKDIRISENMNHLLSNLHALGSDSVQVRGWEVQTPVTTPSALVRQLNITKSN